MHRLKVLCFATLVIATSDSLVSAQLITPVPRPRRYHDTTHRVLTLAEIRVLNADLRSGDEEVIQQAVEEIGYYGPLGTSFVASLIGLSDHRSELVRAQVAEALGRIDVSAPAIDEVLCALARDQQHGVRRAAITGLGELKGLSKTAQERLTAACADLEPQIQAAALEALKKQPELRAELVPMLLKLLRSEHTRITPAEKAMDGSYYRDGHPKAVSLKVAGVLATEFAEHESKKLRAEINRIEIGDIDDIALAKLDVAMYHGEAASDRLHALVERIVSNRERLDDAKALLTEVLRPAEFAPLDIFLNACMASQGEIQALYATAVAADYEHWSACPDKIEEARESGKLPPWLNQLIDSWTGEAIESDENRDKHPQETPPK